jgi:hypothetical protein
MSKQRYLAGQTDPDTTVWNVYGSKDLQVHVDTASARFQSTPIYFCSIGGVRHHEEVVGGSAIYNPTSDGFDIYLRHCDGEALSPTLPIENRWQINWIGVETVPD